MPHILVTGAQGQVGQALQRLADPKSEFSFVFTDVAELDITDEAVIESLFEKESFTHCINCAAYTAVDKAETNRDLARKLNADGAAYLAQACARTGASLLHLSSDYVYHNGLNRPLREDDPTEPKSVYAQTKLEGDLAVVAASPRHVVVRTSWVYGPAGHNFVKTMLRLGKERNHLDVVYDQVGAPTYTPDLAMALLTIVGATGGTPGGIYHYANEGVTSWYDFARAIFDESGTACSVAPILTRDYPTPAARPSFSLLDKSKIKATFGLEIPHWRDSLKHCLQALVD